MEHEVAISQLRDVLGVAYLHVARTNEPVIVARYGRTDVAMVPLWEWCWFKQIERTQSTSGEPRVLVGNTRCIVLPANAIAKREG